MNKLIALASGLMVITALCLYQKHQKNKKTAATNRNPPLIIFLYGKERSRKSQLAKKTVNYLTNYRFTSIPALQKKNPVSEIADFPGENFIYMKDSFKVPQQERTSAYTGLCEYLRQNPACTLVLIEYTGIYPNCSEKDFIHSIHLDIEDEAMLTHQVLQATTVGQKGSFECFMEGYDKSRNTDSVKCGCAALAKSVRESSRMIIETIKQYHNYGSILPQ